jgi:hypothetical protein
MDNLHTRLPWQVWIIGLVLCGVFLTMVLIASIFSSHKNTTSIHTQPVVSAPTAIPSQTDSQLGQTTKAFSNQYFSVEYPNSWTNSEITTSNGKNYQFTDGKLAMTVKIIPISVVSLDNTLKGFRVFGYTEKPVQLGSIQATSFVGRVNTLQENAFIFESKGNVYTVQFIYTATTRDGIKDSIEEHILQTFRIQ